jgi:hypothetical protein
MEPIMNLPRIVTNTLISGGIAAATSIIAAMIGGRRDVNQASAPVNAVSHIAWDSEPPRTSGPRAINTWTGLALHTGAAIFWASIFEAVFGKPARRALTHAAAASAATSLAAYVTDYYIVSKRFRPGYEAYLSRESMFAVYAALAAGFALAASLTRLDDH